MAPSSASWARQSPHHVAQKLSMTTSPRYSDRRRFLPAELLSTKSGASAPFSCVAADTVEVAASSATSAAPLHSALIRALMPTSSAKSSGAASKTLFAAAAWRYEPGLSPSRPGTLVAWGARSVPPVTNDPQAAPLLGFGSCGTTAKRANCLRAATAAALAERKTLRNRLGAVSPDGDRGDATARLAAAANAQRAGFSSAETVSVRLRYAAPDPLHR